MEYSCKDIIWFGLYQISQQKKIRLPKSAKNINDFGHSLQYHRVLLLQQVLLLKQKVLLRQDILFGQDVLLEQGHLESCRITCK